MSRILFLMLILFRNPQKIICNDFFEAVADRFPFNFTSGSHTLTSKRFILLSLIFCTLLGWTAFAQTQAPPKAYKFDEFDSKFAGDVKVRLWHLNSELEKQPDSTAVIVTFEKLQSLATPKSLQNVVLKQFQFLGLDEKKIKMIDGGYRSLYVTELWIIPKGAETYDPSKKMTKFDEFMGVSSEIFKKKVVNFGLAIQKVNREENKDNLCVVKIYGSIKQKKVRFRKMREILNFVNIDPSLFIVIDGGNTDKNTTEFWVLQSDK